MKKFVVMLSAVCLFSCSSKADTKYCAEFTNNIYSKDIQKQAQAVFELGNAFFEINEGTGGDKAPTDKHLITKLAALALTNKNSKFAKFAAMLVERCDNKPQADFDIMAISTYMAVY